MINDTIVALSTAPLTSAIGLIRISGSNSFGIIEKLTKRKISDFKIRNSLVAKIYDNEELVDEVVIVLYKGPNSFTGEDTAEINAHGGLINLNRIISMCIGLGARMADHGEFSKKAFYNGKIDLLQAESINDFIMSKSNISSKLALEGFKGNTSNKIKTIKNKLTELLAHISVNIDYPEYEDIEQLNNEILLPVLSSLKEEVKVLGERSLKGRLLKDGIKTAIIGKPNAGKSSLLNALLGEEKAIVTDIEGTTRDVVEGRILVNGVPFDLLDTAGIREAKDKIEEIGIEKSKEALNTADLVLIVIDGSKNLDSQKEDLNEFINNIKNNYIVVINKTDLSDKTIDGVKISALNNSIDNLLEEMSKSVGLSNFNYNDLAILSNTRQIGLINGCYNCLCNSINAINNNFETDLVAIDINMALDKINEILGDKTKEDLDNEIFSKFCIGK